MDAETLRVLLTGAGAASELLGLGLVVQDANDARRRASEVRTREARLYPNPARGRSKLTGDLSVTSQRTATVEERIDALERELPRVREELSDRVDRVERTKYPGIYRVHKRTCDGKSGPACKCPKSYQASVYSAREKKSIRKHFERLDTARACREDVAGAIRQGKMQAPTTTTPDRAAADLIDGMRDGSIRDRSGTPYKPSTIRGYERVLRLRVLPALGHRRVSAIARREVQALVEGMQGAGLSASTIQNTLNPLQVICRRAIEDGEIAVDPTDGLRLPAVRGTRDRIATPAEAASLIEALPVAERALWATALYAGLRRGELGARCGGAPWTSTRA